ncbi:hypothetical protein [Dongshaea marina]|uniref:hypothetical protein n=1 Tax=Dongshaea marina TaxID=2047966 RepID=UPI000D3E91BD|nr:hypothetical protein [Dongshaea marina]
MKFCTDNGPVDIEPQEITQCSSIAGGARTMVEYHDSEQNLCRVVVNENPNQMRMTMMASPQKL